MNNGLGSQLTLGNIHVSRFFDKFRRLFDPQQPEVSDRDPIAAKLQAAREEQEHLESLHYEAEDYDQVEELAQLQSGADERVRELEKQVEPMIDEGASAQTSSEVSDYERLLAEAAEQAKYRGQDKDRDRGPER